MAEGVLPIGGGQLKKTTEIETHTTVTGAQGVSVSHQNLNGSSCVQTIQARFSLGEVEVG